MNNPLEEYLHKKINHLTITSFLGEPQSSARRTKVICECDCGRSARSDGSPIVIRLDNIISGRTKSCGCISRESAKTRKFAPHPMEDSGLYKSKERLYIVWASMVARCCNPNKKEYPLYGGRGITVCKTWRNDYLTFRRWALNNGYNPTAPYGMCTLDRIDNNKGYKPSNCRWVSAGEQSSNKVNTLIYSYYGRELTARGWSEYLNIDYKELVNMLRQGVSIGQIVKKSKRTQTTDFKEVKEL